MDGQMLALFKFMSKRLDENAIKPFVDENGERYYLGVMPIDRRRRKKLERKQRELLQRIPLIDLISKE